MAQAVFGKNQLTLIIESEPFLRLGYNFRRKPLTAFLPDNFDRLITKKCGIHDVFADLINIDISGQPIFDKIQYTIFDLIAAEFPIQPCHSGFAAAHEAADQLVAQQFSVNIDLLAHLAQNRVRIRQPTAETA